MQSFDTKRGSNKQRSKPRKPLLKPNSQKKATPKKVEKTNKEQNKKQSKPSVTIKERAEMLYAAFTHTTLYIFGGTDEEGVYKALTNLTTEERIALINYYDTHYKAKRGKGLVEDLIAELGDADLFKALALLHADHSNTKESLPDNGIANNTVLLDEVVVTANHPWIKAKTPYTVEDETIAYDCMYKHKTPIIHAPGTKITTPVVRKVLVQQNNKVYNVRYHPFIDDFTTINQNGKAITSFSMNARTTGDYNFIFIIEQLDGSFKTHKTTHKVKTLSNAVNEELAFTQAQSYSDFRQQVALININLSKNVVKDQKGDEKFYIESKSFSENPAQAGIASINHIPKLHYTVKGNDIPKDSSFLWFAEINSAPKEMYSAYSLGFEYDKNATVHGFKRGNYLGKDAWGMHETGTNATFLKTLVGDFTIHCIAIDKHGKATGQVAAYKQIVLPKKDYDTHKKFIEYKETIDESFNKIDADTTLAINATTVNKETTQSTPLNLFLGKSKTNPNTYVLTDLTPGVLHQRDYEGDTIQDVFDAFDNKNTYPDGMLAYQVPDNEFGYETLKGEFTTDGASFWEEVSSGAGWASLGLAAAGIVASFTPAAPLAPALFVASSAAGVASGSAGIIDKIQKGTLTNKTFTLDAITIASSLLGIGGALSKTVLKAGGASIIKIPDTGLKYMLLSDIALNGVSGLMITIDGVKSIKDISNNSNLTTAERIDAAVKVLAQLVLANGLLLLSSKGLKEQKTKKNPDSNKKEGKNTNLATTSNHPKTTKNIDDADNANEILKKREAFWDELKKKYFPDNDWNKTDFITEGINFETFKTKHPNLFNEMAKKYNSIDFANRFLPGIIEAGSTTPIKVTFKKGDELYKIVSKGGNIDSPSPYYLTKSELDFVKNNLNKLEQVLGLPLSSNSAEYDVFKIIAKKDVTAFESIIAQTKQSAKSNPDDFYKTIGGKKQTLIIDNSNTDLWEKIKTPIETLTPKYLPKIY